MTALPPGWRVAWDGDPVPADAIQLRLESTPGFDATSLAFLREGLRPWGREYPLGDAVLVLRSFPSLDEVWTLWMMAWRAQHDELPRAWEAMCHYCAAVRAGLWPDRVDPAVAVQSIYLALAQHWLLKEPPDRARFVDAALDLCRHVGERLVSGAQMLDDDVFRREPAFERYVSLLAADQRLYREDRARGRAFIAKVPAARSDHGRSLPLLVLAAPQATQFKLWARRDPDAPNGEGYPLLVVDMPDQPIVISADPASKVQLGWLAARLDARERARGGTASWYDGARHGGTLVAGPKSGSVLAPDDVVACVKEELRLERVRTKSPRRAREWATVAIAGAAAVGCVVVALALRRHDAHAPGPSDESAESPGGARGEPLKAEQLISLVDSSDGPQSLTHYAMIIGVCGYPAGHELNHTCGDARALRDVLIHDYGYSPENILFMIDRPLQGEATAGIPTAKNLQSALSHFVERYGRNPNSTFLFYYSGHGDYRKGGQQDYGILQPAGYFESSDPERMKGWEMDRIISDIKEDVPARHIMLLVDSCYSGWATGSRGGENLSTDVYSLWKAKAQVALTAAQSGELAWEDSTDEHWGGHGAFTAFLLQALHVNSDGKPTGDLNHDRLLTDEELASYVIKRVPESVKALKHQVQVPRFFRFDQAEAERGQFLFVPARPH